MTNAQKHDFAEACLKTSSIFVHFDGTKDPFECQVPHRFKFCEQVCFQFGQHLPVPIPDLTVTNLGIGGTLSFNGTAIWCWVPWHCVFMITPEADPKRSAVWLADTPKSVLEKVAQTRQREANKVVSLADYRDAKRKAQKMERV